MTCIILLLLYFDHLSNTSKQCRFMHNELEKLNYKVNKPNIFIVRYCYILIRSLIVKLAIGVIFHIIIIIVKINFIIIIT